MSILLNANKLLSGVLSGEPNHSKIDTVQALIGIGVTIGGFALIGIAYCLCRRYCCRQGERQFLLDMPVRNQRA